MNPISDILIRWYHENHRSLPWRETSDPYLIWISEVILQQTRVAQGLDYFLRFTTRFPDVGSLAAASEDEVLKLWQGLGYYSRARSLHTAAQDVMTRFGGVFPQRYEQIRSLRGIGDYTAAAICSFAYNQPYATVDGNVYRVLSRLFDIEQPQDNASGKRYFSTLAQEILNTQHAGVHNQAMMEFGALQCLPKGYDCTPCPLRERCLAHRNGTIEQRPVKRSKAQTKPRYFNYLHIRTNGTLLLNRRTSKDIWQNLYEFPLIETPSPVDFTELQQGAIWHEWFGTVENLHLVEQEILSPHVLSHQIIHARFYTIELTILPEPLRRFLQIDETNLNHYAVSRLTERYIEQIGSK